MEVKLFVATKAFICYNGKVLLLRESKNYTDGAHIGKLDVVGGRIAPGEHFQNSLKREIKEETGLSVEIGKPFFVNESWPIVKGEQWQIIRIFFECTSDSDHVTLSTDHDSYEWIDPSTYKGHVDIIDNLYPAFDVFYLRNPI